MEEARAMNIMDWIRERIKRFLGIEHIHKNPNDTLFQYVGDEEIVRNAKAKEFKLWYLGDSAKIEEYYMTGNNLTTKDYSQRNFFWSQSIKEKVKKVHSGVPKAIIDTLVNVVGEHLIESDDIETLELINAIMEDNDFMRMVNQEQLPLTLSQGWGAYKVNVDPNYEYPLIEYYTAENVRFIGRNRRIEAIVYLDYYKVNLREYVLFETRSIKQADEEKGIQAGSYVEYNLFELKKNNNIVPVPLDKVPELKHLEAVFIPNYNKILGVPARIFHNPDDIYYGRSILAGKLDLCDDLDQVLSQSSQTVKVSTPVEYFPVGLLDRDADGNPQKPEAYNRQFIYRSGGIPSPDGATDNDKIQTTQPDLNFNQYNDEAKNILSFILTGVLSPSTMGIDIAKRDNAEAQREKEKQTLETRKNIIAGQRSIIRRVLEIALDLYDEKHGGIRENAREFSVVYSEFGNPSFESKLNALIPAFTQGGISTERYVESLWGDSISQEEKDQEIDRLNKLRESDNIMDLLDETTVGTDTAEQE